jgi:predicted nucleotidyltransferase component of viral defense system
MAALMGRTEPRDLYDFWYLTEKEQMDVRDVLPDLARKAANKGLSVSEFMGKTLAKEARFKKDWENKLRSQIHELPPFEAVFREAKRHFKLV